jgi:hypothetical protein
MDAYTHACACTPTRKYTGALLRNQHTWYALSLTLQAGKLMRVVGTRSLGVKASMLAGNVLPLQTAHTCIRIGMYARPYARSHAHMHCLVGTNGNKGTWSQAVGWHEVVIVDQAEVALRLGIGKDLERLRIVGVAVLS